MMRIVNRYKMDAQGRQWAYKYCALCNGFLKRHRAGRLPRETIQEPMRPLGVPTLRRLPVPSDLSVLAREDPMKFKLIENTKEKYHGLFCTLDEVLTVSVIQYHSQLYDEWQEPKIMVGVPCTAGMPDYLTLKDVRTLRALLDLAEGVAKGLIDRPPHVALPE